MRFFLPILRYWRNLRESSWPDNHENTYFSRDSVPSSSLKCLILYVCNLFVLIASIKKLRLVVILRKKTTHLKHVSTVTTVYAGSSDLCNGWNIFCGKIKYASFFFLKIIANLLLVSFKVEVELWRWLNRRLYRHPKSVKTFINILFW